MTTEKPAETTADELAAKKQIVCKKCLGVFDANQEFCPYCKVPALWSQDEFTQTRLAKKDTTPKGSYSHKDDVGLEPVAESGLFHALRGKDFTKPLLLLGLLIIIATTIYYFVDKKQNTPTPQEQAAIEQVQASYALDEQLTVGQMFKELEQTSTSFVRVIGWRAKEVADEPGVFFVSFVVDDDMSSSNGTREYFFEANQATGQVLPSSEKLIEKYRAMGYIK